KGDAEEASQRIGDDAAGNDDQSRQGRRFQRYRKALNDIGAVAGDRGFGNRIHRAAIGAGVIFGDDDDQAGDDEAGDAAPEQVPGRKDLVGGFNRQIHVTEEQPQDWQEGDKGQNTRGDDALVERAHDVV